MGNTNMSGHISFAPEVLYQKFLHEQRDKAQIELIEFTKRGMRDPEKNGFRKENSLLREFRRATFNYRVQLNSVMELESWNSARFRVEVNDESLIDRLLHSIETFPEMPIGVAFDKIMILVHPASEFKKDMQGLLEHMIEMETVDFTRPLNAQTKQGNHHKRGWKKRRNNN